MMGGMRRILLLAAVVALLAGCGETQPDLFAVQRNGSVPGAKLSLVVNDGGTAVCNGRSHDLPDPLLLDARQLARDLEKPAKGSLILLPRRGSQLHYSVRTPDGRVLFGDNALHQPPVLYRLAFFVRRVAQSVCHLPR